MGHKRVLHTMVMFFALLILCAGSASAALVGVGTVNTEALRLREEATTDSAILSTVYLGNKVVVLEKENDEWYKVSYKGQEGYMASAYLDIAEAQDADLGYGQVRDVDTVLNVRSGPGTKYDKVTTLRASAVVELIGVENGWYHIDTGSETGYVSGDYMAPCEKEEAEDEAKPEPESAPYDGSLADQLVAYAKEFLGVPYVYGANGPDSFDCSGFTKYVYAHFGYSLNRSASDQMDNGREVALSDIKPGDLIFFIYDGATTRASHVGMYIGDDYFIHASTGSKRAVVISQLLGGSYKRTIVGIRRII